MRWDSVRHAAQTARGTRPSVFYLGFYGIWIRTASCSSGSEIMTVAAPGAISNAMKPRDLSPGMLIITWIVNNPAIHSGSNPSDWRADLTEAAVTNELNAGETKGAPQQSVVNGWYLNDIAVVQAAQNSYIAGSSMRNGNLLALIGLGVAGELIIRGVERVNRQRSIVS